MSLFRQPITLIVTCLSFMMAAFHFYVVIIGAPEVYTFRGTHLLFGLVLVFLLYPTRSVFGIRSTPLNTVIDVLLIGFSILAIGYLLTNLDYIQMRFAQVDELKPQDIVLGSALILIVLEGTRRVIGLALPVTAVLFLLYAVTIAGLDATYVIDVMFLTNEGIFGIPIAVSATYMVLFIIFGAFVEKSGTGKLFMDFAMAVAGWSTGGPAKVACLTSALFGTISGSSTANVMTTGTFTIPLMKRLGYRPAFAGAVEAVASTGGQIMPPIMGAAAFVMAEFMGVSYLYVIKIALVPALLFFFSVFCAIHFEAKRLELHGLPKADLPDAWSVVKERGHQILPLFIIVAVLLFGYSAPYAAFWGCVSVFPLSLLRKTTRPDITPRAFVDAVTTGIRNSLQVIMACASAGIVIGVVSFSGLGMEFTGVIRDVAQDWLVVALILTAIAGIILGMGLPTTPAYIVQTALLVPALIKLGVQMEAAHLFALYFAILSVITPPVAISLYAANGLSGARLWPSGIAAVKLAATGYIVPFMFVYGPSLMLFGTWQQVLLTLATAVIGVGCLASSLHGHLLRPSALAERFLLFAAAIVLIQPGLMTDIVGLGILSCVVGYQWYTRKPEGSRVRSAKKEAETAASSD